MTKPGSDASNEAWQFDLRQLDIVLNSDTGAERRRPWATAMIDAKTRIPLGFYISLEAPNLAEFADGLLGAEDRRSSEDDK